MPDMYYTSVSHTYLRVIYNHRVMRCICQQPMLTPVKGISQAIHPSAGKSGYDAHVSATACLFLRAIQSATRTRLMLVSNTAFQA